MQPAGKSLRAAHELLSLLSQPYVAPPSLSTSQLPCRLDTLTVAAAAKWAALPGLPKHSCADVLQKAQTAAASKKACPLLPQHPQHGCVLPCATVQPHQPSLRCFTNFPCAASPTYPVPL